MQQLRYGNPQEVGISSQRVRQVEELAEKWVQDGITPALVIFVARKGVIVTHRAFGKLKPEAEAPPVELDTIFPLASISKPITATCIMTLVEAGLIDLNHPVAKYIPEFQGERKQEVKLHHLLTHSSGIFDADIDARREAIGEELELPPRDENQNPRIHRWLQFIYQTPLRQAPGQGMSYCNAGYQLLAEIVRRVSGKNIHQYATERIFKPLGMDSSSYILPSEHRARLVRRSNELPYGEWFNRPEHQETPSGPGGVYSCLKDIAIFAQMFLNQGRYGDVQILSPATVRQMTRNQIPGLSASHNGEIFTNASWGLGWNVRENKWDDAGTLRSPRSYCHGGAGGVFIWVDPEYDLVAGYFSVNTADEQGNLRLIKDLYSNVVTATITEL